MQKRFFNKNLREAALATRADMLAPPLLPCIIKATAVIRVATVVAVVVAAAAAVL